MNASTSSSERVQSSKPIQAPTQPAAHKPYNPKDEASDDEEVPL